VVDFVEVDSDGIREVLEGIKDKRLKSSGVHNLQGMTMLEECLINIR
jgi:hypothetical protein